MNTTFTVRQYKGQDAKEGFTINTGVDVLEGYTEAQVLDLARQSKVIKLQIPLRKKDTASEMETYLRGNGYPDAVVTQGIKELPKKEDPEKVKMYNALVKVVGKEEADKLIEAQTSAS